METILSQFWDWLGSGQELTSRNVIAALLCIALYGLFISRERETPNHRTKGRWRSPDSILRGG